MDVLHHQDQRVLVCHRLEEAQPRREELPLLDLLLLASPSGERGKTRNDPFGLGGVVDKVRHCMPKLSVGIGFGVGLEDAGLRLHDLTERPKGDAFAVGQASALLPPHIIRPEVQHVLELVDESALAGTGLADDRDELHRLGGDGPIERVDEYCQL